MSKTSPTIDLGLLDESTVAAALGVCVRTLNAGATAEKDRHTSTSAGPSITAALQSRHGSPPERRGRREQWQPLKRLHDRMPVIPAPEAWPAWLGETTADSERLKGLLTPYPAEGMTCWPVSARVGNVKNNDSSLIEPEAAT